MTEKLYKVLLDGKSCHGSNMEWSLPTKSKPGKWHKIELPLRQYVNGFHLTKDPSAWWKPGATCYEVEVGGEALDYDTFNNKICVEKVRLIKPVTNDELINLFNLHNFTDGEHEVKTGLVYASGSASVRASGSASVTAYGSASVTAYDSALISVRGNYSESVIVALEEESVLVDYRSGKPITSTAS